MTSRFENKKTTLKGELVNLESFERKNFEIEVDYIRAENKAMKIAANALELSEDWIINPKTFEVINEKSMPKQYNTSKIFELCEQCFNDENAAHEFAEIHNLEMRAIPWYTIGGQIWATDNNGEYITEYFMSDSPLNLTKCDMRNVLSFDFENVYTGYNVIATHNETKEQTTRYCAITAENLEKCIKVNEK